VASKRRPLPNRAFDQLQTLLETRSRSADARLSPKRTSARAITTAAGGDTLALLQGLLDMPLAPGDERRRPVTLRSADTQRYPKPARNAAPTWFDTLLQRSSQVLLLGALLVLGYWFINVPMRNWLHNRRTPVVRALSGPSPIAMRVAPTKTTSLVSNAAPVVGQTAPQNDPRVQPPRASATLIAASATAHATAPRATELIPVAEQFRSPALAVEATPTDIPQPTASPLIPSPTLPLLWPTITPVQLGTVSKPSPAPVQRDAVSAQPVAPARPNGARSLPTRLIIPALGLDVPIKEVFIVDDEWEIAEYAAGYLNGSGLPGVPGNLALSGHAGLYGAVFAKLGALNRGDNIYVDAAGVRYRYRLRTASTVWPNQAEVLDSTETPTMTLITCTNWDMQRLVAQADFVDSSPIPEA
jgi:LPXTG-site transpeptidase (sortase) family protein